MSAPSPLSSPDTWDAVARGYTDELVPLFERYAADALRLADLPPGAHVLDVACGPGTLALLAAPEAGRVVAVDFSEAMLSELARRSQGQGETAVEAAQADGQALPFADETFDGVFSMFGLMFFPDRAAGLREAHRVLRPGGRAVISSWAPLDGVPLLAACFGALREALPDLPARDGPLPLGAEADVRSALDEAGFRDVRVERAAHRVSVPSAAAFWATNERSSAPLALVRDGVGPETWERVGAHVVDALGSAFERGPVEMVWPAWIGVGTR